MSSPAALQGLRVLDVTMLLPGPVATLRLAEMGADVLKIEPPGTGDATRVMMQSAADEVAARPGAFYRLVNRGKRETRIDLKSKSGRDVLLALAREADVLVESYRPGVMTRLGVGYETLRAVNPRLVYCAISGYGQDGPYRNLVGHDVNYMGYAGALSVTGPREGAPLTPGVQVADLGGGALMAAFAIAAALHHRRESGQGQFLDVSMTDGVVSWMIPHLAAYFATGRVPERGTFVAPHIIELSSAAVLDREVFGPILHVLRWRAETLDEVIAAINANGYGLTCGIHTRVGGRAERIARALAVGNVYVNRNTIGAVVGSQPFGGSGLSGTGPKAGGPHYLERFAVEQVVSTNTAAAGGNASLVNLED